MFSSERQPVNDSPESQLSTKLEQEPSLDFIYKLSKDLPNLNFYLVGGIVRDVCLDQVHGSKDYDFVAQHIPIDSLIENLKPYGKVDPVGRIFGVIKFRPTGSTLPEFIDIALPRKEFADGTGGYRDFDVQSDPNLPIEEDLARRDLTINAMAYDVKKQKIVDPYDGQTDLENKIIRAVGDPEERFQEDYSRMLRAIRFACRFNFEIEENTWQAIIKLMPHIHDTYTDENGKEKRKVPWETIAKELKKSFVYDPVRTLDLLDQSGALELLLPEVVELHDCEQPKDYHSEGDVWEHTKMMLGHAKSKQFRELFPEANIDGAFILAILLHDIGKPSTKGVTIKDGVAKTHFHGHDRKGAEIAEEIARRLELSGEEIDKIQFLTKEHMFLMTVANIDQVSTNKIARRFIDSQFGQELLMLFYLDASSSLRPDGSVPLENFKATVEKIEEIKAIREKQPQKVIDGEIIMKILGKKSGPIIGIVTKVISELKDRGRINNEDEAETFIEKNRDLILSFYSDDVDQLITDREKIIKALLEKIL